MRKHILFFILVFSLVPGQSFTQDTIFHYRNYSMKMGFKFITDVSNDYSLTPDKSIVYSGGFQFIKRIGKTSTSLESGVYYMSKGLSDDHYFNKVLFGFISIPINFRYDSRLFYFSGGTYVDYFLGVMDEDPVNYYDYEAQHRKLNLGLNLCLGLEKYVSKHVDIFMELRTFYNITTSYTGRGNFWGSYRNDGVAVGLSYKFY